MLNYWTLLEGMRQVFLLFVLFFVFVLQCFCFLLQHFDDYDTCMLFWLTFCQGIIYAVHKAIYTHVSMTGLLAVYASVLRVPPELSVWLHRYGLVISTLTVDWTFAKCHCYFRRSFDLSASGINCFCLLEQRGQEKKLVKNTFWNVLSLLIHTNTDKLPITCRHTLHAVI